ncbi:MAG: DUF547 domain-containing protein [Planctomycetes bacterium]|nr:DUF547 domain-containing protein [Planctomycetota bacterium]
MNHKIKICVVNIIVVCLFSIVGCESSSNGAAQDDAKPQAATQPIDNKTDPFVASIDKIYDSLLKEIITSKGLVRYDLLSKQQYKDKLNAIAAGYALVALKGSQNAQLAILCNAYNVHVLKQVIDRFDEEKHNSVKDISGFFNRTKFIVAQIEMTLDDIENKYVRPKSDPRIHAALVCAAYGCPPLRNEPYTAEKLDDQLDSQCRTWINDKSKFKIKDQELGISKIMKWYKKDFSLKPYENAVDFVRQFANQDTELGKFLASKANNQVETFYMDYNWNLNKAQIPN